MTKHTSVDEIEWFNRRAPSRFMAVYYYLKGFIWKFISQFLSTWPYISGTAFVRIADICVSSVGDMKKLTISDFERSNIFFVKGDLFVEFTQHFSKYFRKNHVFITGNSDKDFCTVPHPISNRLFRWFAQNSSILEDPRVATIPIGIENLAYGNHGRPRHLKIQSEFIGERILFGPMADTHYSRKTLLSIALTMQDIFFIPPERLSHRKYVALSSHFKYVFCPRGNGVDTHRFWESLYRGQTPIILRSEWSDSLRLLNLPFISINNLEELRELAPRLNWLEPDFNPKDIDPLWMPYWKRLIIQN